MAAMFRLIPREEKFFETFNQMADVLRRAADLLVEMVDEFDNNGEIAGRIKDVEHEGDIVTHDLVRKLHQTFVTPLDREDIHALASKLDDVVDWIDQAAANMVLYKVTYPLPEVKELAHIIRQQTIAIQQALAQLGRRGGGRDPCVEIHRLENEGDRVLGHAVARLFEEERDPVTLIKWKEILEALEQATDMCEDVANVLEGIELKLT